MSKIVLDTAKNLLTRSIAFALRIAAIFSDELLENVAPYGTCNIANDALSSWLTSGSAPKTCITHQDTSRCWYTYIPDTVAANTEQERVPLVVSLHGAGGCATLPAMGWGSIATKENIVVVWPEGTKSPLPGNVPDFVSMELNTWNDGSGLFGADELGVDDVGFLEAMLTNLLSSSSSPRIDPSRVYMSGHSNGAVLAQRFALQTEGVVAGVVAVAGAAQPRDPEWSPGGAPIEGYSATPIVFISGRDDGVVPFDERRGPLAGAVPSLNGWAVLNGCPDAEATVVESEIYDQHTFVNCANDTAAVLLEIKRAGHHPFPKGEGDFQISPFDVIAECPFRGIPFFYEPDCQLIELDTIGMAWDFIKDFRLN